MEEILILIHMLVLLVAANGTPVLAKWILGKRLGAPLDGGVELGDGRSLFGKSKTIRGIVLGIAAAAVAAIVLGYGAGMGALFGALSMAGDLATSFLKRRFGLPPSDQAFPFDYLGESILPLVVLAGPLKLSAPVIIAAAVAFALGNLLASRILFRMGIRERPY